MSVDSTPGTTTLYDSNGNPVTVTLNAGKYEVNVADDVAQDKLYMIIALLTEIRDTLTKIQENS